MEGTEKGDRKPWNVAAVLLRGFYLIDRSWDGERSFLALSTHLGQLDSSAIPLGKHCVRGKVARNHIQVNSGNFGRLRLLG